MREDQGWEIVNECEKIILQNVIEVRKRSLAVYLANKNSKQLVRRGLQKIRKTKRGTQLFKGVHNLLKRYIATHRFRGCKIFKLEL